jgi:photoactive yellow protein
VRIGFAVRSPPPAPGQPMNDRRVNHIRLVIVDENQDEAELVLKALRAAGKSVEHVLANDQAQLRASLTGFEPDVVLGDFGLASVDGPALLGVVRELRAGVPIIFLSGTFNEKHVTIALHSGAVDYLLKSSIGRLPEVVERAMEGAAERKRLEQSLQASEASVHRQVTRLESLCRIANDPSRPGADQIHAILGESATALRPTLAFHGLLFKVVKTDLVILAVEPQSAEDDGAAPDYVLGRHIPIEAAAIGEHPQTQCWDERTPEAAMPSLATAFGWHSLIASHFAVGAQCYTLAFGSASPVLFTTDDSTFVEVIASALANQLRLEALDGSLRASERRTRAHAERLEALWRIANNPELRGEKLWRAMLRESAQAIRPGQVFEGVFSRIEDANVILEAVEVSDSAEQGKALTEALGASTPLSETVLAKVLAAGGTFAWDDLQTSAIDTRGTRLRGWRSLIATTFSAGGTTYNLTFAAPEPTREPFGQFDFAYIQILSSFFARHIQERWHFDRLAYQQSHDVLTGLPTRSQFRSLARSASATQERFAMILVDINGFREINATYGSMIGDALLVEVGNKLERCASEDEFVGRVAGDVFGIYVKDPGSARFVRDRAQHFAQAFSQAFSTGDREGRSSVALTASLGIAIAPQDGRTLDEISSRADAALFAAKLRGPGSLVVFAAGMEGDPLRRAVLRSEVIAAIAGNQFQLHFQPHVDVRNGDVVGCEALIRWQHPTRGLLFPDAFIPFAEENGIITGIDEWVMRNACAAAGELSARRPGFRVYFNLSGRQAGDPNVVRALCLQARSGTGLGNIGVEITETDAMRDVEATRRVCRALKRLGVKIAIDDFGVAYSSLASLKRLPVDVVKIDRSFITGSVHDERNASIAETIMTIAERFGFTTVAEGVEDQADLEWLRGTPCGIAQGFYYGRPQPLAAFEAWLDERRFRYLGSLAAEELDALPFGAIVIDPDGTIRSYNRYEAGLSHLAAARLIGKNFFRDVAPCTQVAAFEGRLHDFATTDDRVSASFNYFFPFAHGDVDVDVRFVKLADRPQILIVIERFSEPETPAKLPAPNA